MYGMEELSVDGADSDQLLHWMGWMAETIGQLDPPERATLVATGPPVSRRG
jgi:hypothetical protein